MLAQSPPRSHFSSESDMRRALSLGMDLSPSQLVDQPTQSRPLELQSITDAQGQRSNEGIQLSPLDQRLFLQSMTSLNFENPVFGVQGTLQPLVQPSSFSASPSSSFGHVINPGEALPPLALSEDATSTGLDVSNNEFVPPRSSSASSGSRPPSASFSRRTDGIYGATPNSAPADVTSFGRLNHAARQRTAQACEKCRDRKTKCSGNRPTCKRCSDRGLSCVWATDTRVRGPTRQPRQFRFDLGEKTGEPLSSLAAPTSEATSGGSSPSFNNSDIARSAPANQTSFPTIAFPNHLVIKNPQKRQTWNCGSSVARGLNALSIMGELIRPLTSVDDCWHSVEGAKVETPGRDRAATIRARDRRNSVSVAHLARARSLRDEAVQLSGSQVPSFFDHTEMASSIPYYTAESSNVSSPPPLGGSSSETSESEPGLSLPSSLRSHSVEQGLHQPFPSYDAGSQLSEELAKLLNFPGVHEGHQFGFIDNSSPFTHAPDESMEIDKNAFASNNESEESADEAFAQYFDADAFDKMQE